jgi:Flp pilus assembly pilin Flp
LGDPIPVLISQVLMPTVASLVSSIRGAFHASCDSVGLIV